MKHAILLPFLMTPPAFADEPVVMTNGMVCLRDITTQVVHSCSGGKYLPSGFNEVESGAYYPPLTDRFALDPRTAQPIYLPNYEGE